MATPKNQSVMKAFSLLRSFRHPDEWLTSSELSRRAHLPEASGYRLVQTLEGIGAVVRDARGRYRPGMLLVALSQDIVPQELWGKAPQRLLAKLADDLGVSVQVGVLEDGMVTYVARAGRERPALPVDVGTQLEAYCTALGKVLLAALDERALEAFLLDGELIPLTERTITDPAALRVELEKVRREALARDDREVLDELGCLAMPLHDPAGRVVAAISVSQDADRMNEFHVQQLRGALAATAAAISERIYPWHVGAGAAGGSAKAARITACGAAA